MRRFVVTRRAIAIVPLLMTVAAMPASADYTGMVVNQAIIAHAAAGGNHVYQAAPLPLGQILSTPPFGSLLPDGGPVRSRASAAIQPILTPAFAVIRFVGPQRLSSRPGAASLSIDVNATIQITGPQAATIGFIRWNVPRGLNLGVATFRAAINFWQDGVGPTTCDTGLFNAPPGFFGPVLLPCTVALNGVPAGQQSIVQAIGTLAINIFNGQVGAPGGAITGSDIGNGTCTTGEGSTTSDCPCKEITLDDGSTICDDEAFLEADEDEDGENPPPGGGQVSIGVSGGWDSESPQNLLSDDGVVVGDPALDKDYRDYRDYRDYYSDEQYAVQRRVSYQRDRLTVVRYC
jgi:hypothetical protein